MKSAAHALAAASAAPAPKKKTQRVIASQDRLQLAKAKKLAEEGEPEPEVQLDLHRVDGSAVDFASAVEDIQAFLRHHAADASLDDVRRGVGIDLQQPGLLGALRNNPRIESIALATGERLRFQPAYGVRNRASLAHMLSRAFPGSGEAESVLRSELTPEETYDGVDVDVDELLAQGRCVRVDCTDKKSHDFALFAPLPGRPVSAEVRAMWKAETVPQGAALQEELIKRKLLTKEEVAERMERRAESRRRAKEAAEQPKKQRTGQIRTWANTHLGNTEELEELAPR